MNESLLRAIVFVHCFRIYLHSNELFHVLIGLNYSEMIYFYIRSHSEINIEIFYLLLKHEISYI